jgi:hypothetical protein
LSQWLVPLVRQVLATLDQVGPASADLERLPIVESRDHDGRSVTRLAERNGPRAVWITQEGSLSWIGTRKASSGKAATESEVGDSLATRLTSPGWLVFADLAGARRLVSDRSSIVESIVAHDHVGEAEAQARRDKLLDVLRLADRLVVEAAVDGQGLSAAWRLTAEGPKP